MNANPAAVPTGVRPEIQALRAVAVIAVVAYHLWPARISGGFVGVDVFFVISGFLITAHLLREANASGRINLPSFWARRARRLLPAALTVLAACAVGVMLWIPPRMWEQFFREIGAAGIYVENWSLAADSIDYLASDNVASPVQHFWSLSVEEQFYIVWPVLIALTLLAFGRSRRAIGIVLGGIVAASFVWSIVQTQTEPSIAYFSTFTRAWEFGAGGLLALLAPAVLDGAARLRTGVSIAGWVLIAVTLFTFTGDTPFPGFAAALPVLGTLAVIWAGSAGLVATPTFVGRVRPVQFVGDISYSVYLWHWPLIVFVPFATGRELGFVESVSIFAASILLGWLSKRFIEEPVRTGGLARLRPRFTIGATALAMGLVVLVSGLGLSTLDRQAEADLVLANRLIDARTPCFGAAAFDDADPCANTGLEGPYTPAVVTANRDFDSASWSKCSARSDVAVECVFGTPGGTRVALIGDSHAHVWLPAFFDIAETEKWEVHLFAKGGCSFSHASRIGREEDAAANCAGWNESLDALLAEQEPYEVVFTSQRAEINTKIGSTEPEASRKNAIAGFAAAWKPLIARGSVVVGIHGVPDTFPQFKSCVIENPDTLSACANAESRATRHVDYLAAAADKVRGAYSVDLTRYFCADDHCPAVVGGVLVYRDNDHPTRTFIRTLAPYLLADYEAAIAR